MMFVLEMEYVGCEILKEHFTECQEDRSLPAILLYCCHCLLFLPLTFSFLEFVL